MVYDEVGVDLVLVLVGDDLYFFGGLFGFGVGFLVGVLVDFYVFVV